MTPRSSVDGADPATARWSETFEHPRHGALTFTAALPLATSIARHYIAIDRELESLGDVAPSGQTMLFVAALAGMSDGLLMELPVIREDRVEDPDDDSGRVRLERTFYDPRREVDPSFLAEVWLSFSAWRAEQLAPENVRAVGNDSEPTPGSGSSERSIEPGASSPATVA